MYKEIIRNYVKRFPRGSSRSIARMLMRDEPLLFLNFETTRTEVRKIKKELNVESKPVTLKAINNHYPIIEIEGRNKILILSDIHIPYHNEYAINTILDLKEKFDIIVLNGDIIDCYALSRWERDPRKRFFKDELEAAILFLKLLRNKYKNSRIIYKFGNHEERHQRFIFYKAPELYGIDEISLASLLKLHDFGIEWYENKERIKAGELFILHGHEYKQWGYNQVNPARTMYLRTKKNTIFGHYHQVSSHQEPNIEGKVTACWSTGCLCDLHPVYMPLNRWSLGYAVVETENNNNFVVDNRIIL